MGKFSGRSFIFILLLIVAVGCGSNNEVTDSALGEIESSAPLQNPALISAFGFSPSDRAGAVIAFYSNQRYFSGIVQKVSSQHYRLSAIIGYYAEENGMLQMTGKKTTCPTQVSKYKKTVTGSVAGQTIVVTVGAYSAVLNRIDLMNLKSPPGGMVVETGCFDSNTGAFTPNPWVATP